jgi:transposase
LYNKEKFRDRGRFKMSKKLFNDTEIKILSKNPYVKSVTSKGITYTEEFKRIFITEFNKGMLPREIFEESGFNIEIIGMERVSSSAKRWRASYRKNGISGLADTRINTSGRPRKRELTLEEKYAKLEAQNNFLKAENELLKKIRFSERGLK